MKSRLNHHSPPQSRPAWEQRTFPLAALACLICSGATTVQDAPGRSATAPASATLEETRLVMGKWIETQQIVSKERNDWQQGKEILGGRLELVKKEIASLEEKLAQTEVDLAKNSAKKEELTVESSQLEAASARLTDAVTRLESDVQKLFKSLPAPLQLKLSPLQQRIPEDPTTTKVSVAERFQNVLVILGGVNGANNEITINYEVHTLADGKPSEVKAIYVGLAQAYYVSASGEAGIGRPANDGWTWEPSKAIANDVLKVLEIQQGKHSPAFVPLPVTLQ